MLTREQIEKIRKELVGCAYVPQDAVILNALCDLALSALAPTSSSDLVERLREPRAGIHEDGTEELKTWERLWEQCKEAADALSVREGWVMVPREPTEEMEKAGAWALLADYFGREERACQIYKAMLSALPPAGQRGKE